MNKSIKIILLMLFLLLFAETSLRLYGIVNKENPGNLFQHIRMQGKNYTMEPNVSFIHFHRDKDIKYTFNKQGFRDYNHKLHSNKSKILILGDSISFGLGAEQDKIYPRLLENLLNKQKRNNEVINISVFGYSQAEEYHYLKALGLKYNPDIVILQFYMNDIDIEKQKSNLFKRPLNNFIALKNIAVANSLLLSRSEQLFETIKYFIVHDMRRKYFLNTLNDSEPKAIKEFILDKSDADIFENLRDIVDLVKSRKIKFLLFISPNEVQLFDSNYDVINDKVNEFCEENKIQCYDFLPYARKLSDSIKVQLFLDGLHLSELGHKILANQLYDKVLEIKKTNN